MKTLRYGKIIYCALLIFTCAAWLGGAALSKQLYLWRTETPPPATTTAVDTLVKTPMPAEAIELQDINTKLAELGQTELLAAIGSYTRYQVLARIIDQPIDAVSTVGETKNWAKAHPERTPELERAVLDNTIGISLANMDTAPPLTGRNGTNYHTTFTAVADGVWQTSSPDRSLYFVIKVQNKLKNTALTAFSFYAIPVATNGEAATLPLAEHSYIWCSHNPFPGNNTTLAAGAVMPLLCEVRGGGIEPLLASNVVAILQNIRNNTWQLTAWTKELELGLSGSRAFSGLQLRDNLVNAEFDHPPSEKLDASFIAAPQTGNGPPVYRSRLTTCEERGDCLKTWLAPLEGLISQTHLLLSGIIPGLFLAGILRAFIRSNTGTQRNALLLLALLNLLSLLLAFAAGGSGWGPLVMLILAGWISGGCWMGITLGLFCLPTKKPA